jgi:hypothetical protein
LVCSGWGKKVHAVGGDVNFVFNQTICFGRVGFRERKNQRCNKIQDYCGSQKNKNLLQEFENQGDGFLQHTNSTIFIGLKFGKKLINKCGLYNQFFFLSGIVLWKVIFISLTYLMIYC